MGLIISGYSNINLIDGAKVIDDEPFDSLGVYIEDCFVARINEIFPEQAKGLVDMGIYGYTNRVVGFSASYTYYSNWRSQLDCILKTPPPENHFWPENSFEELINFSDCEGVIGTEVCQKLYNDFKLFSDFINNTTNESFCNSFNKLRDCFKVAANGGAVKFS